MGVSLVIPGRNCSRTIRQCLDAVVPMLESGELSEIVFVDDGSTDDTREIVGGYPARLVPGEGRGPGAARNLGWRTAEHDLVWFVDSDCVAERDALRLLLPHMEDERVGGVSGSYGNMVPDSLLACLIHEEIIQRHLAMPKRVNFLATFNVIYRGKALAEVNGFDERFLKGQDAELSWRVIAAGYELGFEFESRVKHYHETHWLRYLRTQRHQGYWRVLLHLTHKGHSAGDSYSSVLDHLQPPLAMLLLVALPILLIPGFRWIPLVPLGLLFFAQIPLTAKLTARTGQLKYVAFAPMSMIRAVWRGVGMTAGTINSILGKHRL